MEEVAGETHDHPHHRGLFFAHGDINGYNFWATEKSQKAANTASMRLKKIVEIRSGPKSGKITAIFDGLAPDGKPIMTETRTYMFYSGPDLRTVDFDIRIDPLEKLTFNDTKEGTFGIRLATSMSEDRTGRMQNAEGKQGREKRLGQALTVGRLCRTSEWKAGGRCHHGSSLESQAPHILACQSIRAIRGESVRRKRFHRRQNSEWKHDCRTRTPGALSLSCRDSRRRRRTSGHRRALAKVLRDKVSPRAPVRT